MRRHMTSLFLALWAFLGLLGLVLMAPLQANVTSNVTSIGHGMPSNTTAPLSSSATLVARDRWPPYEPINPQEPKDFMCDLNSWSRHGSIDCVGTFESLPYTYERVEPGKFTECYWERNAKCFNGVQKNVPLELLAYNTHPGPHYRGILCEQFFHFDGKQTVNHKCWGTESVKGLFSYFQTSWMPYTKCLRNLFQIGCPRTKVRVVEIGPNWPSPPTETGTYYVPDPVAHTTFVMVETRTLTTAPEPTHYLGN